jgi:hypothetical protein
LHYYLYLLIGVSCNESEDIIGYSRDSAEIILHLFLIRK